MRASLLFLLLSIPLVWISRPALRLPGSHGFYRFFAWELLLALVLRVAQAWFHQPFSFHQVISWGLLLISLFLVISGLVELRRGQPDPKREDPALLTMEKTSRLVTSGIYATIRHPLYSSLFFLGWGAFFKQPGWINALLAACAAVCLGLTAKVEEGENLRHFGEPYRQYMQHTRRFIPFLFIVVFILAACGSRPPFPPTPTIQLQPATDFIDGQADIQPDQVLFAALTLRRDCRGECGFYCPAVEAPQTGYRFSPQEGLFVRPEAVQDGWQPWDQLPPLGLLGYGQFNEGVYVVRALPYQAPVDFFSMRSLDQDGSLVIQVPEGEYWLHPGESWSIRFSSQPQVGCELNSAYTLTNYGLLEMGQVHFSDVWVESQVPSSKMRRGRSNIK